MSTEFMRVVEINGVKVEVDLRTAKRVEHFRIGDPVKVLVKGYSDYSTFPGVIVSFDEFAKLPTINVVYVDAKYSTCELKHVAINTQTKDVEIAAAGESDLRFEKSQALDLLQQQIDKKQLEIKEIESKRAYFLKNFSRYFETETAETVK